MVFSKYSTVERPPRCPFSFARLGVGLPHFDVMFCAKGDKLSGSPAKACEAWPFELGSGRLSTPADALLPVLCSSPLHGGAQ